MSQPNFHFNRYTDMQEEEHKTGPKKTPNPHPIYITVPKNISPLTQLLEQLSKQMCN
jgi:hypothetical protein